MPLTVAEAVAALRAGRPVRIGAGPALLALETASDEMLALLDGAGEAPLLLSGYRAAALGLGNRRAAADRAEPVRLVRPDWLSPEKARKIVDPSQDFLRAPLSPLEVASADPDDRAALALLRLAGLLPAGWLVETDAPIVDPDAVEGARSSVELVSRATLPIEGIAHSQMVVFRDAAIGEAHMALVIGDGFGGEPPLVRIHDECVTGDVFASLKCDCGPQLRAALRLIEEAGAGVLLYVRQEGRGIGIANKLRAYALQDRGLDTVDANERLGFADDERDFGLAAAMLHGLGVDRVRLLTNNPAKVAGLADAGIEVVERVAHHMPTNPHSADYVATKKSRSGHLD